MGIQGLLPLLKSIMVPVHIKDLEGCSVAVDTYSWLHKGALSCSRELCKNLPTSRHIEYCMHRVNLLRHNGVKPILVFDGGYLPMKSEQENKRARIRKENFTRAIEHESNGNSSAAYECYQKAVDISPSIAHDLIQVLKKENISYVVAPYEADAQMTFLALSKQVDAVITEDSDLIPFGCPRIIFKMDKFGQGLEFQYSMIQQNKGLSFAGFTKQMLLEMCILSGCDYLASLPGMGVKRAHALIKRFTNYEKVIKHLRYNTVSVPPLYEESLKKAILTFRHQRVYDPITEDIVHLSSIVDDIGEDLDFLGPFISQDIAKRIAEGDLDPITKLPFQEEKVSTMNIGTFPIKSINLGNGKKRLDLPVQKNTLTKYFCFASIEAKRNFRAPRISPYNSSSNSSLISKEDVDVEDIASKMSCSETASLHHSKSANPVPLPNVSAEDNLAVKVSESSASPSPDILDETKSIEDTFFPQPRYPIHKRCLTLQKEHESKNFPDALEGKTRTENRKVIIRSSYFQHKSSKENAEVNKQNSVTKNDCEIDLCGNAVPENAPYGNSYSNGKATKRRNYLDHCFDAVNVKTKQVCVDRSFSKSGSDEKKFGSNISHLGHYSEVAQKSVENFVSIMSSFRCSSSGSRASGLRAPLKDVRNISTNRSSAGVDFSQFAYVPNNRKT